MATERFLVSILAGLLLILPALAAGQVQHDVFSTSFSSRTLNLVGIVGSRALLGADGRTYAVVSGGVIPLDGSVYGVEIVGKTVILKQIGGGRRLTLTVGFGRPEPEPDPRSNVDPADANASSNEAETGDPVDRELFELPPEVGGPASQDSGTAHQETADREDIWADWAMRASVAATDTDRSESLEEGAVKNDAGPVASDGLH